MRDIKSKFLYNASLVCMEEGTPTLGVDDNPSSFASGAGGLFLSGRKVGITGLFVCRLGCCPV